MTSCVSSSSCEDLVQQDSMEDDSNARLHGVAAKVPPNFPARLESEQQNLVVDSMLKLKCFVYTLCLIGLGFIAAVIETEAFIKGKPAHLLHCTLLTANSTAAGNSTADQDDHRSASDWICWAIKCIYPITASVAIIYLQKAVLVPGTIPEARVHHPTRSSHRVVFLNTYRCIKLPKDLGACPSALFVATYLIFSVPYCVSGLIETACGIVDSVVTAHERLINIAEVARRICLMTFAVLQTRFFFVHYRRCIQWRMSATWLLGCHILATNIATWFFNIGLEVREIGPVEEKMSAKIVEEHHGAAASEAPSSSYEYCSAKSIDKVSRYMYPFVIEYYVMSALLAYTLVANTGRLGAFLQARIGQLASNGGQAEVNPEALLRQETHREVERTSSEFSTLRRHTRSFSLGLLFIVVAVVVSIFVGLSSPQDPAMHCLFYCTLVLLYSCGIVCNVTLLRSLNRSSTRQLSSSHLTDRLLLWLGAAAIALNDSYTFWITWTKIDMTDDNDNDRTMTEKGIETANHALLAASCALNISQSLMQVYAIECALIRRFPSDWTGGRSSAGSNRRGRALLNLLIMLNGAEWIINTVCFSSFFPRDQMDDALVLSLLTMPLQVFYRFHSVACLHDFKRHCEADESPRVAASAASAAASSEADTLPPVVEPQLVVNFSDQASFEDTI